MNFRLQLILVLLYAVFDSDSLFIVKLQGREGWADAQEACPHSMLKVENLPDQRITDCMENVEKSFTGNIAIISEPITFDGCLVLSEKWSNVMNDAMQMKNASVGECAFRCKTESQSINFAVQMEKCKCFNHTMEVPYNINENDSHFCSKCHGSDGICGKTNATAVYIIRDGGNSQFYSRNLCSFKSRRSDKLNYVPCVSNETRTGRCKNGHNVSAPSWIDMMMFCMENGSILSDNVSAEHILLRNTRRYAWFTSERYFSYVWETGPKSNGFSRYCSYILKTETSGSLSYSLNYTDSCTGIGRPNVTHYFCHEYNSTNENVHNWRKCGIGTTSSAANDSTTDMTSKENFYSTNYHSPSSLSRHNIVMSGYYSLENSRTVVTRNAQTKSSVFMMVNQTNDHVTSTTPPEIEKSKENTKGSDKTNLIVPVVVGLLSATVITVIIIIIYCRRMSAKSKRDNSSGVAEAHVTSKAGGLSVQLNVNISAETNNAPVYAVVSKPKAQKVRMNGKSKDDETKARGATGITDDCYVSNDGEYDMLGTNRKHNRTTSSDNEYNIADARTFDNNIYSLAKSIDADGHVDGAYDVALNVSAEMESAPGNDTYDHSSPL